MRISRLTDRRKYIGGSDVAAILGVSPWKTPLDLYMEKTSTTEETPDPAKERIFARGKLMEPYVLQMFEAETGLKVAKRNNRYIDNEYPFLRAEIDAETDTGENIEIKTCNPFSAKLWGEEDTDSIPIYYAAQAAHGLMVTGRNACLFGVLIGSDDFRTYRIERDDELIGLIRQKEIKFWWHVKTKTPPEAINESDLRILHPKDDGGTIECTEDILSVYNDLHELNMLIKEKEERKKELEERIKLFMGSASTMTIDGKPAVTWKAQKSNRFDSKGFASVHPDLYEQFKKATETRVFRIK